jgi:hypothetical protein
MVTIPVNPAYAPTVPDLQTQYVNPVTLNNVLIAMANALGGVTQELMGVYRKDAKYKVRLKQLESDIENIERHLLIAFPPNAAQCKTNKVLEGYVTILAEQQGVAEELTALRETLLKGKRAVVKLAAEKDALDAELNYLKIASDNIRSHLSWVKVDIQQGRTG